MKKKKTRYSYKRELREKALDCALEFLYDFKKQLCDLNEFENRVDSEARILSELFWMNCNEYRNFIYKLYEKSEFHISCEKDENKEELCLLTLNDLENIEGYKHPEKHKKVKQLKDDLKKEIEDFNLFKKELDEAITKQNIKLNKSMTFEDYIKCIYGKDRKQKSRIRKKYERKKQFSKNEVISFIIVLGIDFLKAITLLISAGYILSPYSFRDMACKYFIENISSKESNMRENMIYFVNSYLDFLGEPTLTNKNDKC